MKPKFATPYELARSTMLCPSLVIEKFAWSCSWETKFCRSESRQYPKYFSVAG